MSYEDHGWRHRARGLGGTDPVPPDLPMMEAILSSQSVTADAEAAWTSVFTTDPDTFRYDPGDPAGLLYQLDGNYMFMATLRVSGGSSSVLRAMSVQTGVLSGGPFGGSAVADSARFWSGFTSVTAASNAAVPTPALWEISERGFFGLTPADPGRAALVIDHQGTNFTCSAYMRIVKLANLIGVVPPLPES